MISQKTLYRFFSKKDCVEFEVQCLKGFLAIFNDQSFLVNGNDTLKSEHICGPCAPICELWINSKWVNN
jgi:hypothetical protein